MVYIYYSFLHCLRLVSLSGTAALLLHLTWPETGVLVSCTLFFGVCLSGWSLHLLRGFDSLRLSPLFLHCLFQLLVLLLCFLCFHFYLCCSLFCKPWVRFFSFLAVLLLSFRFLLFFCAAPLRNVTSCTRDCESIQCCRIASYYQSTSNRFEDNVTVLYVRGSLLYF